MLSVCCRCAVGVLSVCCRCAVCCLLCAVCCVLCAVRCALCALRCALCALRSALCALRSALCAVRSALCALRSVLCALRCALCAVRCALCAARCALRAVLCVCVPNPVPQGFSLILPFLKNHDKETVYPTEVTVQRRGFCGGTDISGTLTDFPVMKLLLRFSMCYPHESGLMARWPSQKPPKSLTTT